MNILLLATHLNRGGITRYVTNLAIFLNRRGNKVWVASSKGWGQGVLEKEGIPFKDIPIKTKSMLSWKVFFSFFILIPFIKRNKIEIIHANTRVTQFLGFLLYKFLRIPYVSSFHGFYRPHTLRKLFKFEGVKTIAVSFSVKKHLVNDLKIKAEKIEVIYNGINREEFKKREVAHSIQEFRKSSSIHLGILGRLSEEKGHYLIIEAFKLLGKEYPNIYLNICGRGRLYRSLVSYIEKNHLEERIKFLSLEPNDFLEKIDILVVPSSREGFGYTILEAFAKGVCVVGFNTGGIKEIIRDRENGLLFYKYTPLSLKSAIESLLQNKGLREKLVKKAQQDLNNFSMERTAEATERVYREIKSGSTEK